MADEQKIIVSVGSDTTEFQQGVEEAKKKFNELADIPVDKSVLSLKQQLRESTLEAQRIAEQFGRNSEQFREAATQVGEIRDRFNKFKETVAAFNPENKLQAFVGVAAGATNAIRGVYGAMSLVGVEASKAVQVLEKLEGLRALSDGIESINRTKTSLAAFGQVVQSNSLFIKAQEASTKIAAVTMKLFGVAAEETSVGMKLLSGAITGVGIGLLIASVVLLISKFKDWQEEQEKLHAIQQLNTELMSNTASKAGEEKAKLDALVKTIQDENSSRKLKNEALKELKNEFPGYFDNIKNEKDAVEKLAEAYKKASEGVMAKAEAEAAAQMLGAETQKKLQAEVDRNAAYERADDYKKDNQAMFAVHGTKGLKQLDDIVTGLKQTADQTLSEVTKEVDEKVEFLTDKVVKANQKLDGLGQNPYHNDDKKTKTVDTDFQKIKEHWKEMERIVSDAVNKERDTLLDARHKELNDQEHAYEEEIKKLEEYRAFELKYDEKHHLDKTVTNKKYYAAEEQLLEASNAKKKEIEQKYHDQISKFIAQNQQSEFDVRRAKISDDYDKLIAVADKKEKMVLSLMKGKSLLDVDIEEKDTKNLDSSTADLSESEYAAAQNSRGKSDKIDVQKEKATAQDVYNKNRKKKDDQFKLDLDKLKDNQDAIRDLTAKHNKELLDLNKQKADDDRKIDDDAFQQKMGNMKAIGDLASALGDLFGKQTVANKALNVANALMNTYMGVTEIWKAESVLPEPFGTIEKVAATVTAAASGFSAVKNILAVQVPGGQSTVAANLTAPTINGAILQGQGIQNVRVLNQKDQVSRAYIVDQDLKSQQQKSDFLNRTRFI